MEAGECGAIVQFEELLNAMTDEEMVEALGVLVQLVTKDELTATLRQHLDVERRAELARQIQPHEREK